METDGAFGESTAAHRQLLRLAVDESNAAVYVTDADARIVFINRTFTAMLGYEPSDVYGRRAREILDAGYYAEQDYVQLWADLRRGRTVRDEVRTRTRSGDEVWLTMVLRPILGPDGSFARIVGYLEDTTESRQIQSLQRDVLKAVAEEMPLAGVMRLVCERVEAMFPEVVCSILGVDAEQRLRHLAAPSLPDYYGEAIDGLPIGPAAGSCGTSAWRGEPVTVTDIENDPLWADYRQLPLPLGLLACWSSPIKLRDGRVAGTFAFYFREKRGPGVWHEQVVAACVQLCMLALERHEAKQSIARLAYYDALTGLPNRAKLREEMERRFDHAEAPEAALLFIDIDHFKDVNDTLGHSIGDAFLQQIADRLRKALWPEDIISRQGGDEFVIVLDGANERRARAVAEVLLQKLGEPVLVAGVSLPASCSIGITLSPADGQDAATLMRNADTAMYCAKREGRGTYRFFDREMNRKAQDRLLLGALLRDAVATGQLRLAYQPQIDARTGAVAGVEALARWHHPALGDIPPSRFIPLAEDYGLIEAIGDFSIAEGCSQLRRWDDLGFMVPHLSVNVSAIQFRNPEFPATVAGALAASRVSPDRLTLEITESVMMADTSAATTIANAEALRTLGVVISMDDFGTGYSSLSHLARLPVSELKIDRSFMSNLEENEAVQALVTAVIRIGESLKLRVVAEGVETVAQRRFLEALGCDVLQGYLFGEAMHPADFADWFGSFGRRALKGVA
jgi:diguanylate cyclase (GGDEF)-like protein/PAS domain S-box-containing protein